MLRIPQGQMPRQPAKALAQTIFFLKRCEKFVAQEGVGAAPRAFQAVPSMSPIRSIIRRVAVLAVMLSGDVMDETV